MGRGEELDITAEGTKGMNVSEVTETPRRYRMGCSRCPGQRFSSSGWLAHQIFKHSEDNSDYETESYRTNLRATELYTWRAEDQA